MSTVLTNELIFSDVERYLRACVARKVRVGVVHRQHFEELVCDLLSLVWERNAEVTRDTLPGAVRRAFASFPARCVVRGEGGYISRLVPLSESLDKLTRCDKSALDQLCAVTAEESELAVDELLRSVSPRSAALLMLMRSDDCELSVACERLSMPRTSSVSQLRDEVSAYYAE